MKRSGFSNLDEAIAGFRDGKTAMVYGASGSGKTALCLSFLAQGLEGGETAVLVTAENPESILDLSDVYGWNLKPHLQSRKLRIFEYPPNISESAAGTSDLTQIALELRRLIGEEHIDRIVFDPISPLIEGNGNATLHRCRSVLDPIGRMGAAVLLTMDSGINPTVLGYCKDLAQVTLRMTPASTTDGPRFLRVERHQDKRDAEKLYYFELQSGVGFVGVEAPVPVIPKPYRARLSEPQAQAQRPGPTPAPTPQRFSPQPRTEQWSFLPPMTPAQSLAMTATVMVIDPNAPRRSELRATLQRSFNVLEACSSTDAMTLLSAGAPQAIILALDPEEENGTEIVCNLRQTGCSLPIIGISSRALSMSDHANALATGTDICFGLPLDARVLRLSVFNAICRQAQASKRPETRLLATPRAKDQHVTFTADVNALLGRLVREIAYSQQREEFFVVATIRLSDTSLREQAASMASSLLRPADGVFVGQNGIACLIVESTAAESFLNVFSNYWTHHPAPQFNLLRFDGNDDFLEIARDFVGREIGDVPEKTWAAAAHAGAAGGRFVTLEPNGEDRAFSYAKTGYSHE